MCDCSHLEHVRRSIFESDAVVVQAVLFAPQARPARRCDISVQPDRYPCTRQEAVHANKHGRGGLTVHGVGDLHEVLEELARNVLRAQHAHAPPCKPRRCGRSVAPAPVQCPASSGSRNPSRQSRLLAPACRPSAAACCDRTHLRAISSARIKSHTLNMGMFHEVLTDVVETQEAPAKQIVTLRIFPVHPPARVSSITHCTLTK